MAWSGHWSGGGKGWDDHQWGDNQWGGGNQWAGVGWGGNQRSSSKKSGKDEDRFANCTTLGLKHPLAIDDRRDIILKLLNKLKEDVEIFHQSRGSMNFKLAVASWGPVLIHAVLWLLCKVGPGMKIQSLRNEVQEFIVDDVVEQFYGQVCEVHPTTEDKNAVLQMISACRWGSPAAVIGAAKEEGFNPSEVEEKTKQGVVQHEVSSALGSSAAVAGGEGRLLLNTPHRPRGVV